MDTCTPTDAQRQKANGQFEAVNPASRGSRPNRNILGCGRSDEKISIYRLSCRTLGGFRPPIAAADYSGR